MRLSPWLAPLTAPRIRSVEGIVRQKFNRRRHVNNRVSPMTERLEARTLLTSFTVDSYFDTVDAGPGDGFALDAVGQTSLRAAIMEANANPGADTISLKAGIYSFSIEGTDEDAAATGDLDVLENLQISGESSETTFIDARSIDRVFDVFPGVQLVLFNLTVTGGDLAGRGDGGGVRIDKGTLILDDSVITDSRASNGGAISSIGGNVTIDHSTLSSNRAEGNSGFGQGGAIDSIGGTVTVQQSTINDNHAQSAGGGIAVGADSLGGSLSVENSTVTQNRAGDFQGTSGDGGGIYVQAGVNATILAATIAFNNAGSQGGGVWVNGTLTLERTIVSNNMTDSATGPEGFIASGNVISNGFNLFREDTDFGFSPGTGDLIGTSGNPTDPNLLGLADNGGPTQTIALGGMSPAIDAGPSIASPLFVDQRDLARERDGDRNGSMITDIGAFEVQSPSDFFVDDIGGGTIVTTMNGDFAGDFQVIVDGDGVSGQGGGTPDGILNFGDIVTFSPLGQSVFNLEFGVRAFGTIDDAIAAARSSGDFLNEVVLGPGTYAENPTLDFPNLVLRGHTGIATDVVIDGGGAGTGIAVTADGISIGSLRVTNAATGIDVAPVSSAQSFVARDVQVDGNTTGIQIVDTIGFMDASIENSVVTGNSGDGIRIPSVGVAHLRNVLVSLNGQDGIDVSNAELVSLDTVIADQNGGRGLLLDSVGTIAVKDPRTSANTSGNGFSNTPVLLFKGVEGEVANSTKITDSEIQFDAGAGAAQQSISLTNVSTLFVSGDGGNDTLTIDYSAGPPPGSRQLFLNGGLGNDTIISTSDTHQRLTESRLSLAGVDDIAIANFEQAQLNGGAGDNDLDATDFDGQSTLFGLAGNDTLRGSASDDVLVGGVGDDVLTSGPLREQYILGRTTFENRNLADTDTGVVTILDETDTDVATILLDSDIFRFNGVTYAGNSLFVSPSGVASLGGPIFPQDNFELTNVPSTVSSLPILAPLFDDWVTGLTSFRDFSLPDAKVLYLFEDTNADFINDRLIIEWNDVYHRSQIDTMTTTPVLKAGASPVTFQLILELNTFDRDGDVTFNYVDLDTGAAFSSIADGASATVGGKDGGDRANGVEQVSFNSASMLVGSSKAIIGRSGLSDGDDQLIGGAGDDTLVTSSGVDFIYGGTGANDRLIFDQLSNPFTTNHTVSGQTVESTVFETPMRSYDFKSSYWNIEVLDIGFGFADQNVLVDLNGLPAMVSLDTRGPSASDSVTINGTAGDDVLSLSGSTLTDGTTTINLAGVENLILDISSGGADSISVDQDFAGSARSIAITGDSADDAVSIQSTARAQVVNAFSVEGFGVTVRENLGGDLVLEELLANNGDDGSANTITDQLSPDQIIVSPDGTWVYVAASDSSSLVVYHRDVVTGDLTFSESLVDGNNDFLGNTISGLAGASNVIVSADGRSVYVASEIDRTVAYFVRHPGDNRLTFISSTILDSSGNVFNIDLPSAMAFTPDGSVLMVSSESGDLIAFLEVADSGDLTAVGTFVDGGFDSGSNTIDGLDGASSLAISPDGRHLYVTGAIDNSIAVFSKPEPGDDSGQPTLPLFVQSLTNGDMGGTVSGLAGASSVQVSPDGQHVYVTGETSNSVAVFSRDSMTGQLTFVESLQDGGVDQMSHLVENLLAPVSVSVSPDGTTVYVAASGSDAITVFARDSSTGVLTFLESLANGLNDGAGTSVSGLASTSSVFASTDGRHVYASGTDDDTVVRFNVPRLLDVSADGAAAVSVTTSANDDVITLGMTGSPTPLSIDTGGASDNDLVFIQGTDGDDTVDVNGNTVIFNGRALNITNAENLNLSTAGGDDAVNVTASAAGPMFFSVDGGSQTGSGDELNIDAQAAQVFPNGSGISFSGSLRSVNFVEFETVSITNATPVINDETFSIAENSLSGTVVGTVNAFDPESGESLTWKIVSGNTTGAFAINSSTGQITVNASLDFEMLASYTLVVEVEDQQTLTDTATVTVNINDLNEPPILNPIGNQVATVDQELSFTATASDPDAPPSTLTFSLGAGAPVGASITSGGDFTFTPTSTLDGMTLPVTVIVVEDNAGALMASETFLISVTSVGLDFGDAPATFKTTLTDDGPRHVIGSLFLGNSVDAEVDGQPDAMALGDDLNGGGFPDDENGITFLSALSIGTTRRVRVSASEAGYLDAWIDFDQSGDFSIGENLSASATVEIEGGELLSGSYSAGTGIAVPAGLSTVSFNIPNTTLPGPTFARFRLSSTGGLAPTGLASDGEVEDYLVRIDAPPVGNSNSIEPVLDLAVDGFFGAFPDELNDPDPNVTGNELPLAVQAENGAQVRRVNGAPPLNLTDPDLRVVIQAINNAVSILEQDRGPNENILVLALHPVDFLLTDTQGRTVGYTQAQGTINEIGADATFSGDGVVELLTIRNADSGQYGLQLVGVGGVFRGGSSLITPTGTQQVTFQGSLTQNDDVQLALTYQEGVLAIPARTGLESVDFSEIADIVAQISTAGSDAKTLAAGVIEALASIALDGLDASLFSKKDDEELSIQKLLEQIGEARTKLLNAIETSLDKDERESLKLVFGDSPEETESVEVLARMLLETVSGPLISAPRQVKDLSGSLQQLLEQLREQQKNQQKQKDNQKPANSTVPKGAANPEVEDKRTSQRRPDRKKPAFASSVFVADTQEVASRRRFDQATANRTLKKTDAEREAALRESKVVAKDAPPNSQDETAAADAAAMQTGP